MMQLIKKLSGPKTLLFFGILYTLSITLVLIIPLESLPGERTIFLDKLIHGCIHLLLACVWLLYFFVKRNHKIKWPIVCGVILFCLVYGIIIEASQQQFTATRHADVLDVLANFMGSIFGVAVFWKIKHNFVV